ncbi:unnamed protein product [Camellia sinensis]
MLRCPKHQQSELGTFQTQRRACRDLSTRALSLSLSPVSSNRCGGSSTGAFHYPANLKRSCEILRKRMQNNNSFHEDSFQVRKLEISDKSKGFIELLQQLTVCDSVSEKQFEERFRELSSYGDDHLICVIEDNRSGKIVATGSVFTEKKFIRNCGKVGHIEDVVVDSSARGMQLGKKIVEVLIDHARSTGCYKVILDCSTDNRVFYEKCGFKQKEIQMVKYFI